MTDLAYQNKKMLVNIDIMAMSLTLARYCTVDVPAHALKVMSLVCICDEICYRERHVGQQCTRWRAEVVW